MLDYLHIFITVANVFILICFYTEIGVLKVSAESCWLVEINTTVNNVLVISIMLISFLWIGGTSTQSEINDALVMTSATGLMYWMSHLPFKTGWDVLTNIPSPCDPSCWWDLKLKQISYRQLCCGGTHLFLLPWFAGLSVLIIHWDCSLEQYFW